MNKITLILFFITSLSFAQTFKSKPLKRQMIPGELIVICKSNCIGAFKKKFGPQAVVKVHSKKKNKYSMIKLTGITNSQFSSLSKNLKNPDIIMGPNYQYIGDPRESIARVDDPLLKDQDHHKIIKSKAAWEAHGVGSNEIVVAITDDGVSLKHDDLKDAIWKNSKEIADNGIDDDNNGYIDDVNGWDFSDDDNDPNGGSHGTHVAGIVAATINNGSGGAGIAPGVKIMPIRWYGGSNRWTSEIISKSYLYAVNNGAHIINTSYNIDGFVNDKVYREVVKLVKESGVILFNSAGNGNRKDPPRGKIEEVVLVAALDSDLDNNKIDSRAYFSNYGKGIDIAAPGHPIYSTTLNGKYGDMSGTSMAAPAAAGVAALIWSHNKDFKSEQVLARLYAGVDNIDDKNPSHVGQLGVGRINLFKALSTNLKDPVNLTISLPSKSMKRNKNSGKLEFYLKVNTKISSSTIKSVTYLKITKPKLRGQIKYIKKDVETTYDAKKGLIRFTFAEDLVAGKYIIKMPKKFIIAGKKDKLFKDTKAVSKKAAYYIINVPPKS